MGTLWIDKTPNIQYMCTITVSVVHCFFHLAVVEFVYAHMLHQFIPFLFIKVICHRISEQQTMETVFSGHGLHHFGKSAQRHLHEQMYDVVIHQTVEIMPISQEHVEHSRHVSLARHGCHKPCRQTYGLRFATTEIAKQCEFTLHDALPTSLQLFVSKARTVNRSVHPHAAILAQYGQTQQIAERGGGILPLRYFSIVSSGKSTHCLKLSMSSTRTS